MPFEVMAERGRKTSTIGPMKPVGLESKDWETSLCSGSIKTR